MRVNNILLNHAKRSGFITKVEIVSRQATAQTDYQVQVEDILSRKGDGEDVTFFQKNDILNHWKESYASWKSDAWAKLPNLPITKSQIMNILSGNPSASSASNGEACFEFFDDASGTYSDKWTDITGTGCYASIGGKQAISLDDATTMIRTLTFQNSGAFAIDADMYETEVVTYIGYYQDSTPTSEEHYVAEIDLRTGLPDRIMEDGVSLGGLDVFSSTSTWVNAKLTLDQNGVHTWHIGDILSVQVTDTTYTSGYISLMHTNAGTGAVANLRVRKYASPDCLVIKRKVGGKANIVKAICGGICS